jgi:hypothetical protein
MQIRNDGPGFAHLTTTIRPGLYPKGTPAALNVAPQSAETFVVGRPESAAVWIGIAEVYVQGRKRGRLSDPTNLFQFQYVSPGDTGANKLQTVVIRGSILKMVQDDLRSVFTVRS